MTIFDASASPLDAMAALQAQLGTGGADHPGMAMLMQLLQQQAAPPSAPEPDPAPDVAAPTASAPTLDAATSADLRQLIERSTGMDAELGLLRRRNDTLAAAIGACHLCYGEDDWCRHCGGRGRPGSRRPEMDAFDHYVRPAIARLARLARRDGTPFPTSSRGPAVARDDSDGVPPGHDGLPRAAAG